MTCCPHSLIKGGTVASRLRSQHLAHYSEPVSPTKARRDQCPHAIVKENRTDPIAPGSSQREEACHLGNQIVNT